MHYPPLPPMPNSSDLPKTFSEKPRDLLPSGQWRFLSPPPIDDDDLKAALINLAVTGGGQRLTGMQVRQFWARAEAIEEIRTDPLMADQLGNCRLLVAWRLTRAFMHAAMYKANDCLESISFNALTTPISLSSKGEPEPPFCHTARAMLYRDDCPVFPSLIAKNHPSHLTNETFIKVYTDIAVWLNLGRTVYGRIGLSVLLGSADPRGSMSSEYSLESWPTTDELAEFERAMLDEVEDMMMGKDGEESKGTTAHTINYLRERWGLTIQEAKRLISLMRQEMVQRYKMTKEEARAGIIGRLEILAGKMRQLPDYRGELMALKALAVVLGVATDHEEEEDDFGKIVRRIGTEKPSIEERTKRLLPPPTIHAAAAPKGARTNQNINQNIVSTQTADGVPLKDFEHQD